MKKHNEADEEQTHDQNRVGANLKPGSVVCVEFHDARVGFTGGRLLHLLNFAGPDFFQERSAKKPEKIRTREVNRKRSGREVG